jgi:hypothetical protein
MKQDKELSRMADIEAAVKSLKAGVDVLKVWRALLPHRCCCCCRCRGARCC